MYAYTLMCCDHINLYLLQEVKVGQPHQAMVSDRPSCTPYSTDAPPNVGEMMWNPQGTSSGEGTCMCMNLLCMYVVHKMYSVYIYQSTVCKCTYTHSCIHVFEFLNCCLCTAGVHVCVCFFLFFWW